MDHIDYYPFGGEINPSASSQNYKFTGQERDSETNLDYFIARHYGSIIGRFLQSDPLLNSGKPDDPQSWNRYSYVGNNPLNYVDPFGLYRWKDRCKTGDTTCQEKRRSFRNALAALEKALGEHRDRLSKKAARRLDKLIKQLGKEGEGTITIAFSDLEKGTLAHNESIWGGSRITFDLKQIGEELTYWQQGGSGTNVLSEEHLASIMAHEVGHKLFSIGFTHIMTPLQGRPVLRQADVWQAFGKTDPYGGQIWNESWRSVDEKAVSKKALEKQKKGAVAQFVRDYYNKP